MKKIMLFVACSSLLLSSCDTYTGSGAYAGATFGSILGSAIGGLSGGPRGSDMGTIIGMAGGAAVGAAIGSQADQKSQQQRRLIKTLLWIGGFSAVAILGYIIYQVVMLLM